MGKRHLTPNEIKERCKQVAREKRMCDRSPWTAMGIICSYALLKTEGFKGKRLFKVTQRVDFYENKFHNGEIDLDEISKALYEMAEWTVECGKYTEEDIVHKKGTFDYWLDQKQIEPQNNINQHATRYMLFFFTALNDIYGFGKERLTRVQKKVCEMLLEYQNGKAKVNDWKLSLYEDAGIYFENPIDPLTQTSGSMMTGA